METPGGPDEHARSAWSPHMKQTLGGCIGAKLLPQYGPYELQHLPEFIDTRDAPSELTVLL